MRIVASLERPVRLLGGPANAVVNFSQHTVSLVAVGSDVIRHGKPLTGGGWLSTRLGDSPKAGSCATE